MSMKTQLDAVLKPAADAGAVPGVVAMVTDRSKTLYEGAFGRRALDGDAPMTLDTVGLIASMTKALTSVAALQLLEQHKLDLDSPASKWLPALAGIQVLDGFATDGSPITRAPKQPPTLRHLLTHTSGFGYEFLSENVQKYQAATGTPSVLSATRASLEQPLLFDPGERWEYGIGIDWAGLVVEAVSGRTLGEYLREHVLGPLGMNDTAFVMRDDMRARKAKIHQRVDGNLVPLDLELPQPPEVELGGAGLYGTVGDYVKFVRMILNNGAGEHGRVLREDTVALLSKNHMGALTVPSVKTANPMLSNDMPLPPDIPHQWGLIAMLNNKPLPTGRAAGSLMWAGLANSYYWIDPQAGIAGVFMTQILPFADIHAMPLFLAFEYTTYQSLS